MSPAADPLAAAKALRPLIEAEADACDRGLTLTKPVLDAFTEANLWHLLVPKEFGGLEAGTDTVLDVFEESPASAAGLDAFNDYVVGVGDLLFDGPDEFGELVMHNERRPVRLYIYSVRSETVREVIITPDRGWGGDGYLGCGVGSGYLHTLPPRRDLHASYALPPRAADGGSAPESMPAGTLEHGATGGPPAVPPVPAAPPQPADAPPADAPLESASGLFANAPDGAPAAGGAVAPPPRATADSAAPPASEPPAEAQ